MDQIKIVGHRGVRRIGIENTKAALKEAVLLGADAVEFDVRLTKDKKLVLCHNRSLKKIYGVDKHVDQMNLDELQKLSAANGETIPALEDVLQMGVGVPLMLDVKCRGSADFIYKLMSRAKYKDIEWMVTTFDHSEALRFRQLDPKLWISMGTKWHPFEVIKKAKASGANSITINVALLNPVDYFWARRYGLRVMLFMNYLPFLLTTPWLVRLFRLLYPGIIICTDRPDKIVPIVKG